MTLTAICRPAYIRPWNSSGLQSFDWETMV